MKGKLAQNQRSRSTLHDVAGRAGVSPSTVSAVLAGKSGHRRISEETQTKVFSAASELGYTPNLLHRSMRRGRTHVISFYNAFRNRNRGDLYLDKLTEGIEEAGGSLGYDVLVHCNYQRDTRATYEFLNGGLADGLLFFGPTADEPLLPLLYASNLPTVLMGPRYHEKVLSAVMDDEDAGMDMIAEAILARGHRRIGAIVEEVGGRIDPTGRLELLKESLAKRGAFYNDARTIVRRDSLDDPVGQFLALEPRPTVVFVWHDRTAYQVVEACEARGLRIPHDLSIVGYDGIVWPSLSAHVVATVKAPLEAMALTAVDFLNRLIEGEEKPLTRVLPVRFDAGTTLGPPAS